jgi:hypothetical protein
MLFALSLVSVALAGISISDPIRDCGALDLDSAEVTSIRSVQTDTGDVGELESCYPNVDFKEKLVTVRGVVTAKEAFKGAESGDYFWIQDMEEEIYAGLEIFMPEHAEVFDLGDEVDVTGIVIDHPNGLTVLYSCKVEVVNKQKGFVQPTTIDVSILQDCNEEAEKYEGMLVQIENVEVLSCPTDYRCLPGARSTDAMTWDVFGIVEMAPTANTALRFSVEDYMFEGPMELKMAEGTTFSKMTGVLTYYTDAGGQSSERKMRFGWRIVPRFIDDFEGAVTLFDLEMGRAQKTTLSDILQFDYKYGNSEFSVPASKLGTNIAQTSGDETKNAQGTADMTGSCPNPEERTGFIADGTISVNFCVCYPVEGYNGEMGEGGSDVYWDVEVTVTAVAGWFMLVEDKCEPGNAIYVYYSVSKGEIDIKPGDRVRLVSKPTMFFGIDELDRPLHIERVARNYPLCPPKEITAEHYAKSDEVCTKEADQHNHHFVVIKNVKVSMLVNDQPYPDGVTFRYPDGRRRNASTYTWYECSVCMAISACLSTEGEDMGFCEFEIEDQQGNRMMVIDVLGVDTLQPFFEGIAAGGEESEEGLKLGDTFLEIEGFVMFHRGGYHDTAGGYYVLSPTKLTGFREPLPTESDESDESDDSGSTTYIIIAAVVVLVLGVMSGVLWGAYNHRTVKEGVATATGGDPNPHEIPLGDEPADIEADRK